MLMRRRDGKRLSDISDTRWLETDRAVNKMDTALEEVILDVQAAATGKGPKDPVAIGLYAQLGSVKFIACLALFLDLMPKLTVVTKTFQARELDLSAVTTMVPAAIASVRDMLAQAEVPEGSARSKVVERITALQSKGVEIRAGRHARNPRSRLAAQEALYSASRGNGNPQKKPRVQGSASVKRKRSGLSAFSFPSCGLPLTAFLWFRI